MDKLVIEGGRKLSGTVRISGAKNACLPILAASILTDEDCHIANVPDLKDVSTMIDILTQLGRDVRKQGDTISILGGKVKNVTADYKRVSTMRASIAVLGPLVAR